MARYNTSLASATITGATTIGTPNSGAFTALTGTAPYTVTLPSPSLFPGTNQTFYNATAGTITLSSSSGSFSGTGGSAASTLSVYTGNVISVTSDGTNYIVISEDGSALVATSGTFSGVLTVQSSGGVSIAPSSAGSMDNVSIGSTARSSGAFTTLNANGQVNFTANTSSTTTGTGSLVVTGGVGVSGSVYAGGTVSATNLTATNVTGTLQTASQPNVTAIGPSSTISITAGGLVGVGVTPTYKLHVAGATTYSTTDDAATVLKVASNTSRYPTFPGEATAIAITKTGEKFGWRMLSQYVADTYTGMDFHLQVSADSTPTWATKLFVAGQTGLVGIGLTGPTAKLDVKHNTTGAVIRASVTDGQGSSDFGYSWYIDNSGHELAQINASYVDSAAGGRGDLNFKTRNYTAQGGLTTKMTILANGNIGINNTGPAAKLHVVASTPSGLPSVPDGTTALIDSSGSNYLTFRNTVDNATNAGIAFQDNNIGGYVVFRNYDGANPTISDRLFLAGYQGVNIQYGTANSIDVAARTTAASFDSTGIFWEKRKLVYSQDIAAPTNFVANTWFRFSGYDFNGALDTDTQPGWLVKVFFGNLNPSYGYLHWVTAYIPPLSSNTYSGYHGGYNSSHYGNTSVANSLVFNSSHHTSAGANHDIRLKLDGESSYGAMNLFIWSNTGNSSTYPLQLRIWKL